MLYGWPQNVLDRVLNGWSLITKAVDDQGMRNEQATVLGD